MKGSITIKSDKFIQFAVRLLGWLFMYDPYWKNRYRPIRSKIYEGKMENVPVREIRSLLSTVVNEFHWWNPDFFIKLSLWHSCWRNKPIEYGSMVAFFTRLTVAVRVKSGGAPVALEAPLKTFRICLLHALLWAKKNSGVCH